MTLRIANITFDCEDTPKVAKFWSEAMGLEIAEGASEFFASARVPGDETGPNWFFLKVPEGKTNKNRMHLDLETDDREAEVARLETLGAIKVADKDEWGHSWSVLNDVEGNEFCVSGPHAEAS